MFCVRPAPLPCVNAVLPTVPDIAATLTLEYASVKVGPEEIAVAVFSCINNLGPALGDATLNYSSLNEISKLFLSFAMILGRLEIYTLLVLFTSFFWRS